VLTKHLPLALPDVLIPLPVHEGAKLTRAPFLHSSAQAVGAAVQTTWEVRPRLHIVTPTAHMTVAKNTRGEARFAVDSTSAATPLAPGQLQCALLDHTDGAAPLGVRAHTSRSLPRGPHLSVRLGSPALRASEGGSRSSAKPGTRGTPSQ